jgi:hypothetical protein
MAGATGAND